MARLERAVLVAIFGLSGAVGIAYEVLWLRVFTHVTGSGVRSVSAVVTAFLLGLAIGGAVFGRTADRVRALRLYAGLELFVGVGHLVAFALFDGFDGVYAALWARVPWAVLEWLVFGLAVLFVTVPAALLGGTLPALIRHFATLDGGASAGRLYAINTLGAGAGALALAHGLLPVVGYRASVFVAGGTSIVLGLVALALSVRPERGPGGAESKDPVESFPIPAWLVSLAYAASGFAALGYEVLWSRLLEYVFRATLQSFAYLLLVFLVGLAIGNLAGDAMLRRRVDPRAAFGGLCVAAGLASLGTLVACARLGVGLHLFLGILAVTALAGATFPVALRLRFEGVDVFGRTVGSVYSWNTAGSIAGAFLAGFALVPRLGTQGTWLALVGLHVVAGVAVLARVSRRAAVLGGLGGVLVAGGLLVPPDALRRSLYGPSAGTVLWSTENELEVLAVTETESGRRQLWGGSQLSGSTGRRAVQLIQGHLAAILHPRPERVLEIGYGVGEILRAVNRHGPSEVDLVEIDAGMLPVADEWFAKLSEGSSAAPHVAKHFLDGRHWLAMTDRTYDVILSDTFHILSEGSTRLYTLEHFENGARHLREGGHMVVWLPLNIGDERASIIARTFGRVFPHVLAWRSEATVFLIGSKHRVAIDPGAMRERFERCAREDLALVAIDRVEDLLLGFFASAVSLGEGEVHRDLAPTLDFAALGDWDPGSALGRWLGGPRMFLQPGFLEADRLYEEASRRTRPPARPDWERDLGALSVEDARAGVALLESAVATYPGHREARVLGAQLCTRLGLADPSWLERALVFHPLDPAPAQLLGKHFLRAGDTAAARRYLLLARRAQPYVKPDPDLLPR